MTLTLEEVQELIKHLEHAPQSQVYPMRALELARLAEERLLLEQSIHIGGCTTLFWDGGTQWWVDDIDGNQHLAPTLGEAIRKAAGVIP